MVVKTRICGLGIKYVTYTLGLSIYIENKISALE